MLHTRTTACLYSKIPKINTKVRLTSHQTPKNEMEITLLTESIGQLSYPLQKLSCTLTRKFSEIRHLTFTQLENFPCDSTELWETSSRTGP